MCACVYVHVCAFACCVCSLNAHKSYCFTYDNIFKIKLLSEEKKIESPTHTIFGMPFKLILFFSHRAHKMTLIRLRQDTMDAEVTVLIYRDHSIQLSQRKFLEGAF